MLIILPPSETKARGGSGSPLNCEDLLFTDLDEQVASPITHTRIRLATALTHMQSEEDLTLLGLTPTQSSQLERNAEVMTSPTMPAIERYTGVAYDALDVNGERTGKALSATARKRLAIGSALFGVVSAEDLIPYYRLSAGSKVSVDGKTVTVRSQWSKVLSPALEAWRESNPTGSNGIIDLRSGGYLNLGPVKGAVKLRVETEYPDGSRKVVSHFNKHYKGLVARELAQASTDVGSADSAEQFCALLSNVSSFHDAGFRTEIVDEENVTLIVPS
ncbi:YaaA family protein [Corynebacterium anserum]|uniref:Peroxide stress protein YaaA n=1 Tax=Corynebacterium anserum TaxID=2684406 RepID=A0A7G7YNT6_9CORY|nr:peroxide stress protein YaaA [Corynebacterium anserum]MBC2681748.1 peroxide stress protein YaaA [Corynebacterium anserum]QNH96156.1 peroxide stress protein YaaA [Corynebacterium anserum]